MKIDQKHITQIRTAFDKMQSKEDLLRLLNEAKKLVYGEKAVPFGMNQLTWHSTPKLKKKPYNEFRISKKSGASRTILAPNKGLKALQKTIGYILQCVFEPHKAAMGFVRNKSIVDNARLHEGSRYVYNIDLKDFFSSIDQARVWKCLQIEPFNLNKAFSVEPSWMSLEDLIKSLPNPIADYPLITNKLDVYYDTPNGHLYIAYNFDSKKDSYVIITKDNKNPFSKPCLLLSNQLPSRLNIANLIAAICCTEIDVERKNELGEWEKTKRNVLPQGAPTSPIITNIICKRLDYLLSAVANRFGLRYSRYADDITFSSMHNVYQPESEFLKELNRITTQQGFHINEKKTRLQKDGYRKEVTGLLVNEKANVHKRYIKQLRMWLYYWERYGYDKASVFFLEQYSVDKGHLHKGKPDMANVIGGKLDYLKMVKGGDSDMYLRLKKRFMALLDLNNNMGHILDVWENFGIEKAMEKYYGKI